MTNEGIIHTMINRLIKGRKKKSVKIDLFSIGKFTIHGYGLMIAIGILCCVAMASYRAKKNGLDQEAIVDIGIYGVIGGF